MVRCLRFSVAAALAVGLVLLSLPGAALAAARTVTVLGVTGPNGAAVGALVEEGLGELYELKDGALYRQYASEAGRLSAAPADVAYVCAKLGIDAIVAGAIKPGSPSLLRLAVRDGADGQVIARLEFKLPRNQLPEAVRQRMLAALVRAMERVRVEGAPPVAETPPEPDPEAAPAEPAPGPDELAQAEASVAKPGVVPHGHGIEVGVGIGLLSRSLAVHGGGAISYDAGALPAWRVDVALFPFAWTPGLRAQHPALATFGVVASWTEAFPFQSLSADALSTVDATARRWSAALVSRVPLGGGVRPTLTLSSGFGTLVYKSVDPARLGVPDSDESHLFFGLALDVPFGTRKVQLSLGGAVLGVVDAGALGSAAEYGGGQGVGGDGFAALTVSPVRWLWLRLGARYTAVQLDFHHTGARNASSATDGWFDASFAVGYSG